MMQILINAYAVNPDWGSEPGMGWNWVIHLAMHCKVHVITEGEWKGKHRTGSSPRPPQAGNIVFHYLPVPGKIRPGCAGTRGTGVFTAITKNGRNGRLRWRGASWRKTA